MCFLQREKKSFRHYDDKADEKIDYKHIDAQFYRKKFERVGRMKDEKTKFD